jgi:glyoxylate reductase
VYNKSMSKPKVFITRQIQEQSIEAIRAIADTQVWSGELPPSYEILQERVRGIDGLLCLLTDRIDAALMDAAGPSLKVISQYAVGYDNISVKAATERGIPVGNTPGVLTDATADFTWALLMAAARRVVEGDQHTRSGRWKTWGPTFLLGPDVAGATLGLVGFGRIGQAVARRALGFDMQILYYDDNRHPEVEESSSAVFSPLPELLRRADFISLHVPLSPETYHLISTQQFQLMKPGAVLINTSRGSVIDPQALYYALSNRRIGAAAIDVTEPEPIPGDSPLLALDNLIITPHIASAGIRARTRMAEKAAANLIAGLNGQRLPDCVNPEVYG